MKRASHLLSIALIFAAAFSSLNFSSPQQVISARRRSSVPACSPSDTFGGTPGQSLTSYSSNWTITQGAFDIGAGITTNSISPNAASTTSMAYWNACSPTATQHATGTIVVYGNSFVGPAVRIQAGVNQGYDCLVGLAVSTSMFLQSQNGATQVTLDSDSTYNPQIGDVIRISASGSTISCTLFRSGSQVSRTLTATDSTFSTGAVGITGFDNATPQITLGTWSGGAGI